jgi:hypothetical protein
MIHGPDHSKVVVPTTAGITTLPRSAGHACALTCKGIGRPRDRTPGFFCPTLEEGRPRADLGLHLVAMSTTMPQNLTLSHSAAWFCRDPGNLTIRMR